MNFTDINLDKEIKIIEENQTGAEVLDKDKKVQGYGIQINLTEDTTIFGVSIFGSIITENRLSPIFIQINGYDSVNNAPNQTEIYGQTELNISTDLSWHYQELS